MTLQLHWMARSTSWIVRVSLHGLRSSYGRSLRHHEAGQTRAASARSHSLPRCGRRQHAFDASRSCTTHPQSVR